MTQQTKHTPGPWYLSDTGNLYSEATDRHIANLDTSMDFKNNSQQLEANARLIAAAPELLEALERASKLLKENAGLFGKDQDRILDNVDYFEAALLKATGSPC